MNKNFIIILAMILIACNVAIADNSVSDTSSNTVAQSNNFFNKIFGNQNNRYNNSDRYDNNSNYRNRNRNNNYNNENYEDNQYRRRNRNNNRRNNSWWN